MEHYLELEVNGKLLRGVGHCPTLEKSKTSSVVILFHGFTGSKIDDKFLFVRLARHLETNGIGCVRFDFSGSGESEGEFSEMTFEQEVLEGEAILDFVSKLNWVDPERISLLGFSMGGAVATQVAKTRGALIRKMCLWAPAGNMDEKANAYFESCDSLPNGNVDLDGIELGLCFYEDLKDRDLYEGIERFTNPVLILHGTEDVAVPILVSERFAEIYQTVKLHPIKDADHVFSKLKWRDELFRETIHFLN